METSTRDNLPYVCTYLMPSRSVHRSLTSRLKIFLNRYVSNKPKANTSYNSEDILNDDWRSQVKKRPPLRPLVANEAAQRNVEQQSKDFDGVDLTLLLQKNCWLLFIVCN
jgi:hypothetical protein